MSQMCRIEQGVVGHKSEGGGGANSCNSPTDSCKFPTEEIMGVRQFNFTKVNK